MGPLNGLIRDEDERMMRVTSRAPIHARVMDASEEAELDDLAARVAEHERQEKKKMEATKKAAPKKSIYKHRFSDAPWFAWLKGREVLLLGAGGIGSWVAFALARIGCVLHIYDMDTIEPHNLGGQLYSMDHVGANKADAMQNIAHRFSGGESQIHTYGRFDEDSPVGPIVISAFDNMASRQLAFDKWAEAMSNDENPSEYIFIDGRLLAEESQVYGVLPGSLDAYRATLFADGEVTETMCSLKATTHCSMGIASDIVSLLTNFATNKSYGTDIREVPFSIIRSIPLFTYEIKLPDECSKEEPTDAVPAI